MTTKEMIETLRYKANNIKAKIEPEFFNEVADRLEEYKELEEQGLLIKLPCKAKQKVYLINHNLPTIDWRPMKCFIDEFIMDMFGCYAVLNGDEVFYSMKRFEAVNIKQFGKRVFLDKAAAEEALKKVNQMNNLKIFTKNIEPEALEQIHTLLEQPAFAECKVRIMPDVHAGKGCVIGFTADLGDKVIPNIVGVDIGCGMLTVKLGNVDIDLQRLDEVIREYIPSGRNVHEGRKTRFSRLKELYCYRELKDTKRLERSIGTLGGGNHFIEIDTDERGCKYLIIHTGSRNLGKQVAEYYQKLAVEIMQGKDELYKMQAELIADYKAQGRKKEIEKAIKELHKNFNPNPLNIPKELCYLTGEYREKYLNDMEICQMFASVNRIEIANSIVFNMFRRSVLDYEFFETVHNYIEHDTNMVRKGSISAKEGELLLIPINMRDGCIIGYGKGNEDWNSSAPHGAGRIMSRNKAKENISLEEFEKSMEGIYTTTVNQSTIDESPMAYKPIDEIVENIKDTVDVYEIIKPIYNYKASE